ncbi:MAG: hypothetical protein DME43_09930 [Verrucomicrobia bacterium]|nr:MAG: hypothetical protein DME43_09930 [Verrucomicrobiota bacterium]
MKKFSRLSVFGSFLVIACAALATTVIPPSFDDLVGRAEMIFQGTVTDVHSEWTGEGAQRHIMSYVTVKVEEAIKGNPWKTTAPSSFRSSASCMDVFELRKMKLGATQFLRTRDRL